MRPAWRVDDRRVLLPILAPTDKHFCSTIEQRNRKHRGMNLLANDDYLAEVVPAEEKFTGSKVGEELLDMPIVEYPLQL